MMCQGCQKALATVHMVDIQAGEKQEVHLCEACAQSKGIPSQHPGPSFGSEAVFFTAKESPAKKSRETRCAGCGMTFKEFRRKGRFGCAQCYESFTTNIIQLLDKIQGGTRYVGKVHESLAPGPASEIVLMGLRKRLTRVVLEEQYEEAARLRDQIRQLEERGGEELTSE